MATKRQSGKVMDLGVLQDEAEKAASQLKGAHTAYNNARAAVERAEQAYNVAQKALVLGMEQVKAATRVG